MTTPETQRDLIVVVADLDAENAINAILNRHESLAIREIRSPQIDRYSKRDSGCYGTVHDYLRPSIRHFAYALVIFDRHGCGHENQTRETLERHVENLLAGNGWRNRSAAIVIDPELEAWVFSDSSEVDAVLGWADKRPSLRDWLSEKGLWEPDATKPNDPKQAMERALKEARKPKSAKNFHQLAQRVGLRRCEDPAFDKLKRTLQQWFPLD